MTAIIYLFFFSFFAAGLGAAEDYEVSVLGAPTSGIAIQGAVGAIHKGNDLRFPCYSPGPTPGLVGPQIFSKLSGFKDQPGVFPAPLIGFDSLHFVFTSKEGNRDIIPVIIKPDGTIFKGSPMNCNHGPQMLVIPYPAQTGIYTIFALNQKSVEKNDLIAGLVEVNVNTSTRTKKGKHFLLKPFSSNTKNAEFISAEYIYAR